MTTETIPRRIAHPQLSDYLEVMTRAIFQAGLSWAMIAQRWDAFSEAFAQFDVERVANFNEAEIEGVLRADGVVRSAKKVRATVHNAQQILELARKHGDFLRYLRSFGDYGELAADLKRRFKFLGELSAYYFLFVVGEPVPSFAEWEKTIQGDHPRMREMISLNEAGS